LPPRIPGAHALNVEVDYHRVVFVEGYAFQIGRASGEGCNCLIDTVKQLLEVDVPSELVRTDLQREFREGDNKVTRSNFLDFEVHLSAIVRSLDKHARAKDRSRQRLDPNSMQFTCIDLVYIGQGASVGNPSDQHFYIARENANHFVPMSNRWET